MVHTGNGSGIMRACNTGFCFCVEFTITDTAEIQKVEMKDDVPIGRIIINKKGEFLSEVSWNDMVAQEETEKS